MANTLDFTIAGRIADRNDMRRKMPMRHQRTGGPDIFGTYYDSARDRVASAEPVASLQKFMR